MWSGEEFTLSNGAPVLFKCRPGYLLVNSTVNTQECLFCIATTYSLDPFDRCGLDGSNVCGLRDCFPCSVGAECFGGAQFEPKVGSIDDWDVELVPDLGANLYRIQQAPPG